MKTYLVPFLAGNGTGDIMLTVTYIADGFARGVDGQCAFCHGDPCAERSAPESHIAQYVAEREATYVSYGWPPGRRSRPEITCPMCQGRPS